MPELPLEDFDEVEWDSGRRQREEAVIKAVYNLSHYMGCNSFTLPTGLMKIKVNIISEQVNALSD